MNYTLVRVGHNEDRQAVARDRAEALAQFSRMLGFELTEDPDGHMTDFLLDEWEESPHFTNPTISVFRKR